jgi:hypothetical protein
MSRDRSPNQTTVYWLIENPEAGRTEELTVRIDARREALPVFSFPEEAEMFLKLGGLEERGWRIVRALPESSSRDSLGTAARASSSWPSTRCRR